MMSVPAENTVSMFHLDLPLTWQQEALIRYASEITNQSIFEFILRSICTSAENALLDQRLFFLDDEKWQKFQNALNRPAVINSRLAELMRENTPWE